jgi:phage terminase large subunit-like protein
MMSDIKKNLKKFDLDAALDSIDLSFNGYTPTEDSLEFFSLMRMVQGENFEFDTPLFHYWLVDLMFGNITRDHYPYSKEVREQITINTKRICIVASRGIAKSTVVTAFYPIYCAIKGKTPDGIKSEFHLLVAASQQGGGRVMAKAIQSLCEDSVFCKNWFESMRFTETESEFIRKGTSKVKNRVFLARYIGIGGGIRGVRSNIGAERPDHIIFDDVILNSDTAYSETIMGSLRTTIKADAINALRGGGKGKIFSVATPFHLLDPVIEMLTGGAYTPVAIPICEKIYEGMPKSEYRGAWPSMHPYEAVIEQYESAVASNATREFNQERMLRISSAEDRMITDEMIESYSRKVLLKEIHAYNIYITTDFTTTSEAKSDFSAISAWAVNSNRDFYLVDLCVKRQGIGEQYEELFRMVNFWSSHGKSVEVGVEIDGQQKAHLFALKEMMLKKSEWFRFAKQKGAKYGSEGILSRATGGDKHGRFRNMLPQFQNHKIHFPTELETTPDMIEARKQLKYTTWEAFGGHDDFPDTISQLGMMEIVYPSVSPGSYSADSSKDRSIWRDLPSTDNDSAYSSYA